MSTTTATTRTASSSSPLATVAAASIVLGAAGALYTAQNSNVSFPSSRTRAGRSELRFEC